MKISSVLCLILFVAAASASFDDEEKSSIFLRQTAYQHHRVEIETVASSLIAFISKIFSAILSIFRLQGDSNNESEESILNRSDMPSLAPSDMPSFAPSDVPSIATSDTPSLAPSDMPSDHPSVFSPEWDDNSPNDDPFPEDFDVCANSGKTEDNNRADLTVLYGYKLELASGGKVFEATKEIETKMHEAIQSDLCLESDVLAISADPLDIPGALCNRGDQTTGNGPCFFIAGRMRLFIKQESILNSAGVYCMVLEAARNYMATVNATIEFQDVVNIESTIVGSLVPTFCNFLSQGESGEPEAANAVTTDTSVAGVDSASKNSKEDKAYVMPAAVAGASVFVAIAALLLVRRRRKLARSELNINSSSSSSARHIDTMGDGVSPRTESIYLNSVLSRISFDTERDA